MISWAEKKSNLEVLSAAGVQLYNMSKATSLVRDEKEWLGESSDEWKSRGKKNERKTKTEKS